LVVLDDRAGVWVHFDETGVQRRVRLSLGQADQVSAAAHDDVLVVATTLGSPGGIRVAGYDAVGIQLWAQRVDAATPMPADPSVVAGSGRVAVAWTGQAQAWVQVFDAHTGVPVSGGARLLGLTSAVTLAATDAGFVAALAGEPGVSHSVGPDGGVGPAVQLGVATARRPAVTEGSRGLRAVVQSSREPGIAVVGLEGLGWHPRLAPSPGWSTKGDGAPRAVRMAGEDVVVWQQRRSGQLLASQVPAAGQASFPAPILDDAGLIDLLSDGGQAVAVTLAPESPTRTRIEGTWLGCIKGAEAL